MTQQSTRRIDPAATVNEILLSCPSAVSVFNEFGIDACCGGDASLTEAARRDGVELESVIDALEALTGGGSETAR